jgi:uncharacterized membrane protein
LSNTPGGVEYLAPLLAVVNIAISIPLILRKIPPNVLYGFRTKKTLSDSRIWYEANAIGGKYLVVASIVTILCWVVVAMLFERNTASLIDIGIFLAACSVAIIFSMVQVRRL